MSVRRVFASGVGFVCLCPGGCVEVSGGGWRAWGGRFLVFLRIFLRVGRIEVALRFRSSLRDFCMLPYFSFQEWYACRVGRCSSG